MGSREMNIDNVEMDSKYKSAAQAREQSSIELKMGKRMAYLLRYGAEKEGLVVYEGGYVDLMALLKVPLMKRYPPYQVLQHIKTSKTQRGTRRFDHKQENGTIYIRAAYGRKMERNPNHTGTLVPRLLEMCMDKICNNLKHYNLQDFPDEFLLNSMIHKLRRAKKLNNKAFQVILVPTIEHLDLGAVYLTEGTIKLVGQRCPNLRVLSLRECGYMLTDHLMEILMKKLRYLESLNLSGCHHLTDRSMNAIIKNCPNIQLLSLTGIKDITEQGILNLLCSCPKLEHIDIFDNKNIGEEAKVVLKEFNVQKGVVILLEGFECDESQERVTKDSVAMSLAMASISQYW